MIERFRRLAKEQSPLEVVKTLIRDIAYKDELTRQYPERRRSGGPLGVGRGNGQRRGRLHATRDGAGRSKPTIGGFVQEVALTGNEAEQDKESKLERNAVALMTLHAAKGLEFSEVYMVGMEEGTLPHHRSIAEAEKGTGSVCRNGPGCSHKRTCPLFRARPWTKNAACATSASRGPSAG